MKKVVAVLALFIACCHAGAISNELLIEEQWQNFKLEHNKFYQSEDEEHERREIFMENLYKINKHNDLYFRGLSSYYTGLNYFGDLTEDEFLRRYTVKMPQSENLTNVDVWGGDEDDIVIYAPPANQEDQNDVGDSLDWRQKGYVTSVKNQGSCGSCWSFSAAGALEGQWFKVKSQLVDLSEQNLLDCSAKQGTHGCNGGWMDYAFQYVIDNGGIDTLASYPYKARVDNCQYNPQNRGATASKIVRVPRGENNLKLHLTTAGPIAFAMEVIGSFQIYGGGVYDDPNCSENLNHAMLIVGYGNEKGKDYWLVKNSWGTRWGESGYIKMVRNKNNQCGVSSAASYPVV